MKQKILQAVFAALVCAGANAQVNSGSDGSDGAFNPTATNTVINMTDHPTGIYQYTSVNIPTNVTVTFIPNVSNTPVVWLIQSNCAIDGTIDVSGQNATDANGAAGGPGGFAGGHGSINPSVGQGPGGGNIGIYSSYSITIGGNGSFGTQGDINGYEPGNVLFEAAPGQTYGNSFLIPLIGGSGGGGGTRIGDSPSSGGGGGGGAMLIAASGSVAINGCILAYGGSSDGRSAGWGSGGGIRIIAGRLSGTGRVATQSAQSEGEGRVRLDTPDNEFIGSIYGGVLSQGFQPVIFPTSGQGAQLTIASVGGVPVSASPTGAISTPDAVLSAQQNNPISIVVNCANLPLNTQITVSVKPANGSAVSATGLNNSGTLSSSTATISIVMPRGGGLIYATAAMGN